MVNGAVKNMEMTELLMKGRRGLKILWNVRIADWNEY